jgi:hypothetical protein
MTDGQGKTRKEEFVDRLEKAKGRLQQSFPEIQQLIRTSDAIEIARKIIDPARSIFRQFADDIQLKDLLAKAEALVASADMALAKGVSKETPPAQTFRDATPSGESARKSAVKKTSSKAARPKKAVPKKTLPKKKKKRAPKRNLHRRHARA